MEEKAKNAAVAAEEMQAIHTYCLQPLEEKDVFTFRMVLCDNEIDRDYERFSKTALEKMAGLFLGITGIFDHNPKGKNQTARIFKTDVVPLENKTTLDGEPYYALQAKAYMVRTGSNADLVREITGGIKKEVSIGCSMAKKSCSICGADQNKEGCTHKKGRCYHKDGKKTLCHHLLEEPTDAYEWSFVAVPAQVNAGVVKNYRPILEANGEEVLKKLYKTPGEVALSLEERQALCRQINALKQLAKGGEHYLGALREEVIKYAYAAQGFEPKMVGKICDKLELDELQSLRDTFKKAAQKNMPLKPQLAGDCPNTEKAATSRFKI